MVLNHFILNKQTKFYNKFMKILLINAVYGIGSTGKIVQSLYEEYKKSGHIVGCFYGRHSIEGTDSTIRKCAFEIESKIHHLISKITGNMYGGMHFSTKKLIRMIEKFNPDVIHLHILNGYFVNVYKLINFLKKNRINTVLTNHSDMFLTGNCGNALDCCNWEKSECRKCNHIKRVNGNISLNRTHYFYKKMKLAFEDFDVLKITNVSPWLTKRATISPILNKTNVNTTVLNPIDDTFFSHSSNNPYNSLHLKSEKIVFYLTASFDNPEKGGQYLFPIASKMPDVTFVVKSSLTHKKSKELKNVIFIDDVLNQKQIADYYHYANCSIILSEKETFSMVVAESLCEGTPVVGFLSGGPETISMNQYSLFSEYSNVDSFVKNLNSMLSRRFNKTLISDSAFKKYHTKTIAKKYIQIYEKNI